MCPLTIEKQNIVLL